MDNYESAEDFQGVKVGPPFIRMQFPTQGTTLCQKQH